VEVSVEPPDRKIDSSIMHRQRHVADRMCEIKADNNSVFLCCSRDFFNIEELTGEKVHTRQDHQRELVCLFFDELDNVIGSNSELAFARARQNERVFWIEPVMYDLRFDGVGVRG